MKANLLAQFFWYGNVVWNYVLMSFVVKTNYTNKKALMDTRSIIDIKLNELKISGTILNVIFQS